MRERRRVLSFSSRRARLRRRAFIDGTRLSLNADARAFYDIRYRATCRIIV